MQRRDAQAGAAGHAFGSSAPSVVRMGTLTGQGHDLDARAAAGLVRVIVLLSALTNLGPTPAGPGSVPGAAKAPEALCEAGLR
jgi:hypothetical protein